MGASEGGAPMNQTIAGKYPVFGVSYISPSFLSFSRAGSTGRRCGWLGSRSQLAGETVEQKDSGLSPREWRELMATLGR